MKKSFFELLFVEIKTEEINEKKGYFEILFVKIKKLRD